MRSVGWALVCALLSLGCRVGFKSAGGAANSPEPLGKGATHSLRFYDEGGILTRAGLAGLGVLAAAGSVKVERTTTEVNTNEATGKSTVTTTTIGTIDQEQAKKAAALGNAAADPGVRLGSARGSLAGSLEIASTKLGGDTSGGQFDFGYSYRIISGRGGLGFALHGYAGFGYGHFTFHDRLMVQTDRGPPHFGDGTYAFLGVPMRLGAMVFGTGGTLTSVLGVEAYAKIDANFSDATIYHFGGRLQYALVFAELEWMRSSRGGDGSLGLEIGIGF